MLGLGGKNAKFTFQFLALLHTLSNGTLWTLPIIKILLLNSLENSKIRLPLDQSKYVSLRLLGAKKKKKERKKEERERPLNSSSLLLYLKFQEITEIPSLP